MSKDERQQWIEKVDSALNSVRPHLKVDGGDVEVVDVTDEMLVKIKWLGNCQTCSMTPMTMRAGIEETLKHQVPEVIGVEAVNGI